MLKKRSRPVTSSSKQAMAGEHSNLYLPPEKTAKPNSFFFNSPRFLKNFFAFSSEPESIMSPTSILDTKPFSAIANTFWADKKIPPPPPTPKTSPENKHSWNQPNNSKGIGIALADVEENSEPNIDSSKQAQKRKLVVFGSQLRIQVPQSSVFPSFSPESAASPGEFGIKTPKTSLRVREETPDVIENESISMIDIEQSEDYTCVISHGPNPKTTHIFGNCIVESSSRDNGSSSNLNGYLSPCRNPVPSPENFLSFCHHCKKHLGQGKDIYMYRGEKAFCSEECRCQEMLFDRLES